MEVERSLRGVTPNHHSIGHFLRCQMRYRVMTKTLTRETNMTSIQLSWLNDTGKRKTTACSRTIEIMALDLKRDAAVLSARANRSST